MELESLLQLSKQRQLVPILSHINPADAFKAYFFKIHFNIILPSTPRSSKWFLSFRFSHQNLVCTCPLSHAFHMPRPCWFDHQDNTWWGVPIMKLFAKFPLAPGSSSFEPRYLPHYSIFLHSQPTFFPQRQRASFTPKFILTGNEN